MPNFTDSQKYQMAQKRQAIKAQRRYYFKARAGSPCHVLREIKLNRLVFELKAMQEWGQFQQQKSNNSA